MKAPKIDDVLAGMRREQPDEEVVRQTARRVFRNVFDIAYIPERVERIRGCADFERLIPEYLNGGLPAARLSLFEDHVGSCVDCRRALAKARGAKAQDGRSAVRSDSTARKRVRWIPLAMAASLAIGTAIGITGAFNGLLPGQHAVRASVLSVQGTLYRVNEFGSTLLKAGAVVRNAEELRTAKGSRAIFQLMDGAQVEMGERSDVSVSRSWGGTSVEVERGRVIVNPARASGQGVRVAAGDLRVPVKNAVVAVNRGTKGTRVAVAQGSATVEQPSGTRRLHAGDQFSYRLSNVSLESEFAWSSNADRYLALLSELSTLQKQWKQIPAPGLRYSSDLTEYLPANTVIYAAIPNIGGTLTEAKRIFDERLQQSEVLRDWWRQQPAARTGEMDEALKQIGSVSEFLGNEIVIAVAAANPGQYSQPVFLAEVRRPGLEAYMAQNLPASLKSITVTANDRFVIASPDRRQVDALSRAISQGAASGFAQTPFYGRLTQAYSAGAGYLLAIDMEQTIVKSVSTAKGIPPGLNNVKYLVLERRAAEADNTETRASLFFAGGRAGVASWLGMPGPMGSLDFVSPDANLAAAIVMKTPLTVMQELISYATAADAHSAQTFSDVEEHLGVKLTDDLAEPFGGDATFAIDGPLVPIPSWKFAVEVYDVPRLKQTVNTLVEHFNQHANADSGRLQLSTEQMNGRTFYLLRNSRMPLMAAYYTFVDGYLLAGPNEELLFQAIQNRETGYTLANSRSFQGQLPLDNFTNFSAVLWHNAGKSLEALANQVKATGAGPATQKNALLSLLTSTGPGLICVYGEPDRIVAATKGDFMGFNIGTLAGMEQGQSLPWLIASRRP